MSLCHILPWKNFGDELGPPVVKRILELHFGCSTKALNVIDLNNTYIPVSSAFPFTNRTDTCLMTVGSLWRMIKSGDHVWGTGVAYENIVEERCKPENKTLNNPVENVTVYSSRGPFSANQIQEMCSYKVLKSNKKTKNASDIDTVNGTIEGSGDAGFLVPFLFPELQRKTMTSDGVVGEGNKRKCLIPHKLDHKVEQDPPDAVKTLNVGNGWVNMILALQDCDVVASSSLHGIILAEALGIANSWLKVSSFLRFGPVFNFKFDDFYMSYRGLTQFKHQTLSEALSNTTQPLTYTEREAYAKRILKTFPMHLFQEVDEIGLTSVTRKQEIEYQRHGQ
mmetsp:Transcript_15197/g.18503  ORF Transcript_15197/g.18503 Transcript_15197/m.18503 type:complete len:337 (-) Transcript_15197:116-1126(-)